MLLNLVTALLSVIVPAPSATPREPQTIITVVSSPYCKSLAEHFNNALVPMLANDRTLDGVSVQLEDFNTMFQSPELRSAVPPHSRCAGTPRGGFESLAARNSTRD